jgi:hypothetical protein
MKSASFRQAPGLTRKYENMMEIHTREKCSSLYGLFVSDCLINNYKNSLGYTPRACIIKLFTAAISLMIQAPGLVCKCQTKLESLARDKTGKSS